MYRDDRDLVRQYLRGVPVPLGKLEEVIAAACNRFQDDGVSLVVEMVFRFLGELRPDGLKRWLGGYATVGRKDLLTLLEYVRGGRVPRAELEEIIAAECDRLVDDGIDQVAKMMLRILDGLRPEAPGRKARGQ